MSKQETIWQYHVKELYDGTNDAGDEDTGCCPRCGKWIEKITASFDSEPLCVDCALAGEAEE